MSKCKYCKLPYEPRFSTMQPCCGSPECVLKLYNVKKKKERKIEIEYKNECKKRKAKFYENDTKTRKAAARLYCHKYIRERDKNDLCISSGRKLGEMYDAGHFLESGNNPFLRYHEDNIHAQSTGANRFQGGDPAEYERRLRIKIGDEKVDWLIANKSKSIKRTAQDYKDIENYYKAKLKELQGEEYEIP